MAAACLVVLALRAASETQPPGIPPLPLNTAEVMVEVFFDPKVSCFREWKVEPGAGCGFKMEQNWAALDFHWASKPASRLVMRIRREFNVDCARFEKLIVGGTTPGKATLKVAATTDKGEQTRTFTETGAQEFILDLAGEMYTAAGRDYILRRLGMYATSWITYRTWKHEYIFECNQLAYFNQGRVCAYLAMEPYMPRVKKYLQIAIEDIQDSFKVVLEPDGGYLEGPSYFCATARRHCETLDYYARAKGLNVLGIVPEQLRLTADYAQAIASTTQYDYLPICDCDWGTSLETWIWLARIMPDSYWVSMAQMSYANNPGQLGTPVGKELFTQIPRTGPQLKPFVCLPDTGYIASHRRLGEHWVKIMVMGNKANAGHTHEDKGSFMLEFAGQAFATDLGIGEYDDPVHQLYKHAQRHNMLCPTGTEERPAPPGRLPFDVKPTGSGDATSFQATIDASPGWGEYYRQWTRTWDSPAADRLTIRDEYELVQGDGVVFYWQTALPFEVKGSSIEIRGQKGIATLQAPPGTEIKIDEMPMQGAGTQKRIGIHRRGTTGNMEVSVSLKAP